MDNRQCHENIQTSTLELNGGHTTLEDTPEIKTNYANAANIDNNLGHTFKKGFEKFEPYPLYFK